MALPLHDAQELEDEGRGKTGGGHGHIDDFLESTEEGLLFFKVIKGPFHFAIIEVCLDKIAKAIAADLPIGDHPRRFRSGPLVGAAF